MYTLIKEDGVHDSVVSDYHYHHMIQTDSALYEGADDEQKDIVSEEKPEGDYQTHSTIAVPDEPNDVIEPEVVDHVIAQKDLDANPDLEKEGVKLGDTVQITKKSDVK